MPIAKRANFNDTTTITAGVALDEADVVALQRHLRSQDKVELKDVPRTFTVSDVYHFSNSVYVRKSDLWPPLGMARSQNGKKYYDFFPPRYKYEWSSAARFLRERMPAIWYFPNFLFDFPSRIYLREQPRESATGAFYRALLQDILDSLDIGATVEDHILKRALSYKSADKRALDSLVLQMGRHMSVTVFDAWSAILQRPIDMRVSLLVQAEEREGATEEPYIAFQIEDNDGFFSVNERSLGFRWFFVFLLLTRFRGERKDTGRELLFLFDEPASNLHSSAQTQLLNSLGQLSRRSRVIYTTHSHHLINPDWLEQTFVVRNKGADVGRDDLSLTARQTDIAIEKYRVFASAHPDQSQYFQPVLDVLDYIRSRLELVEDLVLVEGKNDFYALRYGEMLSNQVGLHLYPGGGAGSLDQVIALYIGWARNFIVLLDSDTEGEAQRRRYLSPFGAVLEGRVFTVGDILAKLHNKALDAIFTKVDREAILSGTGNAASGLDKKRFFRQLQMAVASKRRVPLSEDCESDLLKLRAGLWTNMEGLRRQAHDS